MVAGERSAPAGALQLGTDQELRRRSPARFISRNRMLSTFADLAPDVVERWRRDGGFVPPGGESLEVVAGRMASFCDEWVDERVIVAVSHVSPIKAAVTWTLRVPPLLAWRMRLDVASVTRIGRGPVLLSFNETP